MTKWGGGGTGLGSSRQAELVTASPLKRDGRTGYGKIRQAEPFIASILHRDGRTG
jgi:hypothetical protein